MSGNSLADALKGAGGNKDSEPKAGEPKAGEPKAGEPKASEPKASEPKAAPVAARKPKVEKPKRAPGVYVADGKTVTSRKGLLKSGASVTVDCFGGGDAAMERLIDRGVLVEVK